MDKTSDDYLLDIAFLMNSFKADELMLRLAAIRRLPVIAEAIGPERTRKELIPFISSFI